jgi:hypothetical protein
MITEYRLYAIRTEWEFMDRNRWQGPSITGAREAELALRVPELCNEIERLHARLKDIVAEASRDLVGELCRP